MRGILTNMQLSKNHLPLWRRSTCLLLRCPIDLPATACSPPRLLCSDVHPSETISSCWRLHISQSRRAPPSPAVDLHIRYCGQVTVLLSAVALSFSPAHPQVSDEDVLMDIVCGAYMDNKKVTGSVLTSEYEKNNQTSQNNDISSLKWFAIFCNLKGDTTNFLH